MRHVAVAAGIVVLIAALMTGGFSAGAQTLGGAPIAVRNPVPSLTQAAHTAGTHTARAPLYGPNGRAYPMKAGERFSWSRYTPASGSGLQALSGVAEVGFAESEGEIASAVPAGVVPALPANFAPDVLVNQDLSSTPHNETAIAINPKNPLNMVVGANDYRLGYGSSGFYATTDGGRTWRDGIIPFPTTYLEPLHAAGDTTGRQLLALDGGGDPAIAFDRAGTAYYADINFHRQGCASMVLVGRSINGGLTWNRPLWGAPSAGDTRDDGDGVVQINNDDQDCTHFYDKEFIAAGPRPRGATLVTGTNTKHLSPDRVYVTFTDFILTPVAGTQLIRSPIMISYSDDQGRHWSAPAEISGSNMDLCGGYAGMCTEDQGSVPVVDPRNGKVFVYFFNADTLGDPVHQELAVQETHCPAPKPSVPCTQIPDQLLVVSSTDGGAAWTSPALISSVRDDNMPLAGEVTSPDPLSKAIRCPAQGAGRAVLGNTCFRWGPFGNISIDPKNGRLYAIWSDNRAGTARTITWNGSHCANVPAPTPLPDAVPTAACVPAPVAGTDTPVSITVQNSNLDVYVSSSTNGVAWTQAKRVNTAAFARGDQFYPWSAVGPDGALYVSFLDRSADRKNHDIGETLCTSRDGARTFSCSPVSTGLWNPDSAFRAGIFIGDYTGIAAGPLGAFPVWPDARRSRSPRSHDNPPLLLSDVVGSFSLGHGPLSVEAARRRRA